MEDSFLDIIARSTAKTIEDVSKLYRETLSGEEPQAKAAAGAASPGTGPNSSTAPESDKRGEPPFFGYGTPFADIMRFTKDVEVFTRHIDAQTRGSFEQGGAANNEKK